jgi:hypothetical protein
MGFDGKGLGINGQGMTNPIQVEEIPHYAGLGYVSGKGEVGECSKTIEEREAREDPKPLALQKQPMQGDGTPLHDGESECKLESRKVQPFNHGKNIKKECKASPKRDEHPKGGGKTFSPHQTCTNDNPKRYDKHEYSNVFFNYEKNGHVTQNLWYAYPCTFFGLNNHCVAMCWKRNSIQRKIMSFRKEARCKDHSPSQNGRMERRDYCPRKWARIIALIVI